MTPSIIYWELGFKLLAVVCSEVFRGSETGAVQPGEGSRDTLLWPFNT